MPHTRWTLAVTAFVLWFAVTSCASERQTSQQDETQPALSTEQLGQTERTIVGAGKESDCILSTPDIHLWCTWISRYY